MGRPTVSHSRRRTLTTPNGHAEDSVYFVLVRSSTARRFDMDVELCGSCAVGRHESLLCVVAQRGIHPAYASSWVFPANLDRLERTEFRPPIHPAGGQPVWERCQREKTDGFDTRAQDAGIDRLDGSSSKLGLVSLDPCRSTRK